MNLEKNNLAPNIAGKALAIESDYSTVNSPEVNDDVPAVDPVEAKLASIALGNIINPPDDPIGPESDLNDEKLIEKDRNHFGYSIISYFEGSRILQWLGDYSDYVTGDDLLILDSAVDSDRVSKLNDLLQFENALCKKIKSDNKPLLSEKAGIAELSKYKRDIKTEYLIKFNRDISDYITSVSKGDNSFKAVKQWLVSELKMASSSNMNSDNELAGLNISRYHDNKQAMDILYGIVNGMRHEEGFKELLNEMPDDLIDYAETSPEQDSRGIDVILKAKISNAKDFDGSYKYASSDEIASGDYKVKCLPVDIKSTRTKAKSCLENELQKSHNPNHWVMWSNLSPEDFMLYVDADGKKAKLQKDDDEAVLFLGENQIDAMKNMGYLTYKYKNGDKFKPPTLNSRLGYIKREVLKGINTLYYDAN